MIDDELLINLFCRQIVLFHDFFSVFFLLVGGGGGDKYLKRWLLRA